MTRDVIRPAPPAVALANAVAAFIQNNMPNNILVLPAVAPPLGAGLLAAGLFQLAGQPPLNLEIFADIGGAVNPAAALPGQ